MPAGAGSLEAAGHPLPYEGHALALPGPSASSSQCAAQPVPTWYLAHMRDETRGPITNRHRNARTPPVFRAHIRETSDRA